MKRSCIWNFKPVKRDKQLPKSWEEFCKNFQIKNGECYFDDISVVYFAKEGFDRKKNSDKNVLPDKATAEGVLALCQLIQLRNCFNGDWVPDWNDEKEEKYIITYGECGNIEKWTAYSMCHLLAFKTKELRDEFLRYFRPLIEKLKPLYGIKEGGEE